MQNLDGEQITGYTVLVMAVVMFLFGLFASCQDHTVKGYYVSMANNSTQCVKASYNWEGDDTVYCTDDVNKAIEVVTKLNQTVKH